MTRSRSLGDCEHEEAALHQLEEAEAIAGSDHDGYADAARRTCVRGDIGTLDATIDGGGQRARRGHG
jgi:hypothetical protein